jgi:hypothetical protein
MCLFFDGVGKKQVRFMGDQLLDGHFLDAKQDVALVQIFQWYKARAHIFIVGKASEGA